MAKTEKDVKGKRGRDKSYSDTGKRSDGMAFYTGTVSISKTAPKIVGEFSLPTWEELVKLKTPADKDRWYNVLVGGAFAEFARNIRASNNTFIKYKGQRVDALSLPRKKLARFLESSYEAGGKIVKRIRAIETRALAQNLVTRSDEQETMKNAKGETVTITVTTFAPVPEAAIVPPSDKK